MEYLVHPKTVAIICPGLDAQGAVANVARHHAEALSHRFNVTLISDGFSQESSQIDGIERIRIGPRDFRRLRRLGHVPRECAFALEAKRALRRVQKDSGLVAVMCHGHPAAAFAALPLKKSAAVPYVLVTHGDIFERPAGTYDPRLTWFYRRTTPVAYRHANLVVALSPYMQECARRWIGDHTRLEMLPNGVDIDELGRVWMGPRTPDRPLTFTLLYVGRIAVEKGIDVLIDAAALLARRGVEFRLIVVGDGPMLATMKSRAAAVPLVEVEFPGRCPREKLGTYYSEADVVCLPSLSDSLPMVALEAQACGCPVVGSDVGGIPFIVTHEETGLIVNRGDAVALADAISRLQRSPDMLTKMGRQAARDAAARFSWARIGAELVTMIESLA